MKIFAVVSYKLHNLDRSMRLLIFLFSLRFPEAYPKALPTDNKTRHCVDPDFTPQFP